MIPNQGVVANWKKQGLKSKEEGLAHILKCLVKDRDKLLGVSKKHKQWSEEVVFWLGDRLIRLT